MYWKEGYEVSTEMALYRISRITVHSILNPVGRGAIMNRMRWVAESIWYKLYWCN
jgi:hypothetical protein